MASVLGNNSRASGAQGGQVKCKLKKRRRRRSKRKGKTLPHLFPSPFFFFAFPSIFLQLRAEVARTLAGALERTAARATPRRFSPLQLRGGGGGSGGGCCCCCCCVLTHRNRAKSEHKEMSAALGGNSKKPPVASALNDALSSPAEAEVAAALIVP